MIGVPHGTSQNPSHVSTSASNRCAKMPVFTAMKLIDVSVPIDATLPSYPGNTPFSLEAVKRIAQGASSNVSTLHMSAHTGTHVDAPRHFFDSGAGHRGAAARDAVRPDPGRRGHDAEEHRRGRPCRPRSGRGRAAAAQELQLAAVGLADLPSGLCGVTESGARYLVDHGIKVVGVDYLSVEEFKKSGAPAHHILLGAGTIVIEG